ncbi:sensor histidine kinase [Planomonospora sp. ID67723]|uniref:sensor histidine kinase n=1 Tax=Planomonospora sp. ID67723 TaxID=2738134 RepID=UPI0018C39963|nr:sensor histidine kinase [Planomonospora sp. ID67723]MBG0833020.1 sensor histidine kinase [Planomonospora sp. ID67723]
MRNTLAGRRPWLRDRPLIPDAILAVLLAAASVPFARTATPLGGPPVPVEPSLPALVLIVTGCLSTVLRHRRPFTALFLVTFIEVVLAVFSQGGSLLWLASLVLVYTVAAGRGLALSLCALAVSFTGRLVTATARGDLGDWTAQLLVAVLTMVFWLVGRSLQLRRAYLSELRDRADRTARAREADTRAARAEERSRIARELHDVVAHHVSVMTVQAAAARRVLPSNPDGAREALSAIEETGRAAMAEMRNIVGVLRTDPASPAERGPQPGVQEVPALVEQMCEAGLRTDLRVERAGHDGAQERCDTLDGLPPLPPGMDLAAYRLVQEALTNSLRHAGADARAWVTVRHGPGELVVHVEDDGQGPRAARAAGGRATAERIGHGLVGIRERVALYGGILRIGPRPGGGFEVRARFPIKD